MTSQNDLCVRCNKNKKARRNMCATCCVLDKREQDIKKGIYRCIHIKCKNIVVVPETDCDECKNYPKQFLLEENYGTKPCTKSPEKQCLYENCYCCVNGKCVKKQIIGTEYCKNCYIKTEREKQGLYTCSNIERCKNILMSLEYLRCEKCRGNERSQDKIRRDNARNQVAEYNYKICPTCCQKRQDSEFIGLRNQVVVQCLSCREANKKADNKRPNRDRLEHERKPEIRETRQKYREEHKQKLLLFNQQWRAKQKTENKEEYLKKMAEQMYKWRKSNPEKYLMGVDKHKQTPEYKYGYYKQSAETKNLDFEFDLDDFEDIIFQKCVYCGYYDEKYFNGIDRLDPNIGYTKSNSVPCCTLCNMIKNTMSVEIFLKKCEHILTNLKIIDGNLYPDMFFNHLRIDYGSCKKRAIKKNIHFGLSKEEYNKIKSGNCYVCNKSNTYEHHNGIDRFNNDKLIGYIYDNCRPCCGDCNYMKKNYKYDDYIQHLRRIYNYSVQNIDNINEQNTNIYDYNNYNNEDENNYYDTINV